MKNKQSGQALIEFVIILPVLILLIFSFVDLGRIILENNRLETVTTLVVNKYQETTEKDDIISYLQSLGYKNIDIDIATEDRLLKVTVTKDIDIMTPVLNNILGDPYEISVERVVNYEE